MLLQSFHGEHSVAKACGGWSEGHRLFLSVSSMGTDWQGEMTERRDGGWGRRHWWVLWGSSSPSEVYSSRGSPVASLAVMMYWLPSRIPLPLSLNHTLNKVQQQCRGGGWGVRYEVGSRTFEEATYGQLLRCLFQELLQLRSSLRLPAPLHLSLI